MKTYLWRVTCAVSLLLGFISVGTSQLASAAALASTPVSTAQGTEIAPRTDGATIVWTDYRSGDIWNADIYATNIATNQETPIATGSLDERMPDVSGNFVVWEQGQPCPQTSINPLVAPTTSGWAGCNHDIYAENLSTKQVFAVANTEADETDPAISGNWVAWITKNSSNQYSLQVRNVSTMAPAVTLATVTTSIFTHRVAIDGTRVVWGEISKANSIGIANWQLLTMEIGHDTSPQTIDIGTIDNDVLNWDLHGDTVVYGYHNETFNLKVAYVRDNSKITIKFPDNQLPSDPTTDGRYIFFEDYSVFTATNGKNLSITGYDLNTESTFNVALTANAYSSMPYLRNGTMVWQEGQLQTSEIASSSLEKALPSGSVITPVTANPNVTFFPETNHTTSFGFKYFWDHSGGLAVFGYPLTEEFSEANQDDGKVYTVQYFERERFEYHPEFKGTPYETELGRLGVLDAQQRNLLYTAPFQAITNNHNSGCVFFPTGHQVCGEFLTYWQSHGLDFGDQGFSYRESLALFGYPISEPFTDPTTGLTTQYFERAKFELHTNFAGTPNEVELGLLGKQLLNQRGWQ